MRGMRHLCDLCDWHDMTLLLGYFGLIRYICLAFLITVTFTKLYKKDAFSLRFTFTSTYLRILLTSEVVNKNTSNHVHTYMAYSGLLDHRHGP